MRASWYAGERQRKAWASGVAAAVAVMLASPRVPYEYSNGLISVAAREVFEQLVIKIVTGDGGTVATTISGGRG
jgi:hypothetical protein